jgi:hypothetical protein
LRHECIIENLQTFSKKLSTAKTLLFTGEKFANNVLAPSQIGWGKGIIMKEQSIPEVSKKTTPRPRKPRVVKNKLQEADYFGEQYCSAKELENPDRLLRMLAPAVVEVIAGVRNISQLAAHLSEDVYMRLRDRSVKVAQERAKRGEETRAPQLRVGSMKKQEPRDGVVESVVLVQSATRTRAVTIRLEGINRRWRATSVSVI